MFRKIIGAFAGAKIAKHTDKVGGPLGAVIGTIAIPVLSRMSLPAMAVLGAGGIAAKKLIDRRNRRNAAQDATMPPSAPDVAA